MNYMYHMLNIDAIVLKNHPLFAAHKCYGDGPEEGRRLLPSVLPIKIVIGILYGYALA
jgi:hypothetical protein